MEHSKQQRSTCSKDSRVQPVFRWLIEHGGKDWPAQLLTLSTGLGNLRDLGIVQKVQLEPEASIPASASRLAWMIRHVEHLTPRASGSRQELLQRVAGFEAAVVDEVLIRLDSGTSYRIPAKLKLEGATKGDCLIECENILIWVEGKRNDWLSPSIKWDVSRDQLARNLEAVWSLAQKVEKDFCVVICSEGELKDHEKALVTGYRNGTLKAGFPHLSSEVLEMFRDRIGTVTWAEIANHWKGLQDLAELSDI